MRVTDDYPQMKLLLWGRAMDTVTEAEALALYESNRQRVEPASMSPRERAFFDDLVKRYGRGVLVERRVAMRRSAATLRLLDGRARYGRSGQRPVPGSGAPQRFMHPGMPHG